MAESPNSLEEDAVMYSENPLTIAHDHLSNRENDENGRKCQAIEQESVDKEASLSNGEYDDAILYGKKCLPKSGDKEGEMNAYMLLAEAHLSKGEYDGAILYSEKCFIISQQCDSKVVDIKASTTLGKAHFKKKEYDDAVFYSKICLAIAEESGDKESEMNAYKILGEAYFKKKEYDDAIFYSERCLAIAEESGDKENETDAYKILGEAHFKKKESDDAIFHSEIYLAMAEESGDREGEMNAYNLLGEAHLNEEKYDDAIFYGKRCLAIAEELGSKEDKMSAYILIGLAHLSKRENDDAILYSEECLAIAKESGSKESKMNAYILKGLVHLSKIENDDAILYIEKGLAIAQETGSIEGEITAYIVIAIDHFMKVECNDAITYSRKCLAIAQESGDKEGEMNAYMILGAAHLRKGEYADALLLSEKCVLIAQECGVAKRHNLMVLQKAQFIKQNAMSRYDGVNSTTRSLAQKLDAVFNMAEQRIFAAYKDTPIKKEDFDNAVLMGKQYLTVVQELGNKEAEMQMCRWLGSIYLNNDKYDDAHYYLKVGMNIAENLGDKDSVLRFRILFCNIYESLGMNEELLIQSMELFHSKEWRNFKARIIKEKSHITVMKDWREGYLQHRQQHEYEQAIWCLENLISVHARAHSNHINRYFMFLKCSLSEMYVLQRQYDKGIKIYQEVLDLSLKDGDKHLVAKCHFGLGEIYFKLGQIKKAENSIKESLQCFEFLFDHVGQNDQFKIAFVDKYKQSYKMLFKILFETDKKEEALLLSDRYRARALKDILVSRYGIKIESSQDKLQYTDVQALVSTRKFTLLSYSTSLEDLCTFLVQEGNQLEFALQNFKYCDRCLDQLVLDAFEDMQVLEVVGCEDRSLGAMEDFEENKNSSYREYELTGCTGQCHSCVSRGNSSKTSDDVEKSMTSCLEILYHKIIHKVKGLIVQDEIVIIPEGSLFEVPFAALRDPDTGQYLSETKRIRLAPSMATLKLLQECPVEHHSSKDALIIGDPLVGRVMMNGTEREFDPLRGALEEAVDIALILKVRPLLAAEATKPAVLEKLQQGVSVVHIAAHGSLSKAAIVLAPSPKIRATKIPDEEDYLLTMADVQKTQVRAQLVVLSCCHSGRGQIKAEGVVGMCRAFLASGARAVIGSLWAIDDQATRKFMKKFYKYLKDGQSACTSLHLTMNDMRSKPQYNKPKYWAPFFLMGDDVTISL